MTSVKLKFTESEIWVLVLDLVWEHGSGRNNMGFEVRPIFEFQPHLLLRVRPCFFFNSSFIGMHFTYQSIHQLHCVIQWFLVYSQMSPVITTLNFTTFSCTFSSDCQFHCRHYSPLQQQSTCCLPRVPILGISYTWNQIMCGLDWLLLSLSRRLSRFST